MMRRDKKTWQEMAFKRKLIVRCPQCHRTWVLKLHAGLEMRSFADVLKKCRPNKL